jgi:hypothetical protein
MIMAGEYPTTEASDPTAYKAVGIVPAKRQWTHYRTLSSATGADVEGSTIIGTLDLTEFKSCQLYVSFFNVNSSALADVYAQVFPCYSSAAGTQFMNCQSTGFIGITRASWFTIPGGNHTRFIVPTLSSASINIWVRGE